MFFKVVHRVHVFLTPGDSFDFDYDGNHNIRLNLRALTAEETATGRYSRMEAICTAVGEWEPSPRVKEIYTTLNSGEVPSGTDSSAIKDLLDEAGRLRKGVHIPFSALPEPLRSFEHMVFGELDDKIRRTIRVSKWRLNKQGPHNPVVATQGYFHSFDGETWTSSSGIHIDLLWAEGSLYLTDDIRGQIREAVSDGTDEPIGRELFREAWE